MAVLYDYIMISYGVRYRTIIGFDMYDADKQEVMDTIAIFDTYIHGSFFVQYLRKETRGCLGMEGNSRSIRHTEFSIFAK